jgi:hypothetical protein
MFERKITAIAQTVAHVLVIAFEPDIVRVRFSLCDDSSGCPAVFFRILLSDKAARQEWSDLGRVSQKCNGLIGPFGFSEYGYGFYTTFRSEGEQSVLKERIWE